MRASYNGFSPRERQVAGAVIRKAIAAGTMSWANDCSVCRKQLAKPHHWHLEDYTVPTSAYPVCRRCHYAIHIRFARPALWHRFLSELPPGAWVADLSVDMSAGE